MNSESITKLSFKMTKNQEKTPRKAYILKSMTEMSIEIKNSISALMYVPKHQFIFSLKQVLKNKTSIETFPIRRRDGKVSDCYYYTVPRKDKIC